MWVGRGHPKRKTVGHSPAEAEIPPLGLTASVGMTEDGLTASAAMTSGGGPADAGGREVVRGDS